MARIKEADHLAILKSVDEEKRPVAAVAAAYGCTPANIYALLRRLRAAAAAAAASRPAEVEGVGADLFGAGSATPAAQPAAVEAKPGPEPRPAATVTDLPRRPAEPVERPVGARLAKPGYGLIMRTAEGEETTAPFRSLEDLLTAIKPVLRAAARDPEPVWFSIQPLDLAAVEFDAA